MPRARHAGAHLERAAPPVWHNRWADSQSVHPPPSRFHPVGQTHRSHVTFTCITRWPRLLTNQNSPCECSRVSPPAVSPALRQYRGAPCRRRWRMSPCPQFWEAPPGFLNRASWMEGNPVSSGPRLGFGWKGRRRHSRQRRRSTFCRVMCRRSCLFLCVSPEKRTGQACWERAKQCQHTTQTCLFVYIWEG